MCNPETDAESKLREMQIISCFSLHIPVFTRGIWPVSR